MTTKEKSKMITFQNVGLPFAKDAVADWKDLPPRGLRKLTFFDEGVNLECLTGILVQIGRRDDYFHEPCEKGLREVEFLFGRELDYLLWQAKLRWNTGKEQIFNMDMLGVDAILFNGTFTQPYILPVVICFKQKQSPLEITWAHPIGYKIEDIDKDGQLAVGVVLYGSMRDNSKEGKEKMLNGTRKAN